MVPFDELRAGYRLTMSVDENLRHEKREYAYKNGSAGFQ
jgi:hypothetical protein